MSLAPTEFPMDSVKLETQAPAVHWKVV